LVFLRTLFCDATFPIMGKRFLGVVIAGCLLLIIRLAIP
jgi:hypothetical protein